HHYFRAFTEQDPQTVEGRKLMYQAERLRKAAEPDRAIAMYTEAFDVWKKVLARYEDFRKDDFIQEQTYEAALNYHDLVREHRGLQVRPALEAAGVLTEGLSAAQAAFSPALIAFGLLHGLVDDPKSLPLPVLGPLDGTMPNGERWVRYDT